MIKHVSSRSSARPIILLLCGLLALVLKLSMQPGVLDPYYAFIGDEYSFYEVAGSIFARGFLVNPFAAGVYEGNSLLASLGQALFLLLPLDKFVAFKISTIILHYLAAALCGIWIGRLYDLRSGVIAFSLVILSFFFNHFSMIPYPNMQGVCWMVFVLILVTEAHRQRLTLTTHFFIGMAIGASLYFYYGAAIPFFIGGYVLVLKFSPGSEITCRHLFLWSWSAALAALPGLLDVEFIGNMFERLEVEPLTLYDRQQNILKALRFAWAGNSSTHFISGPFLDSVTSKFLLVGLLGCMFGGWKDRRTLALATLWLLTTVLVGALNGYPGLSNTRSIFLVVPACALSAIGITCILNQFRSEVARQCLTATLILAIYVQNLVRDPVREGAFRVHEMPCLLTLEKELGSAQYSLLATDSLSALNVETPADHIAELASHYHLERPKRALPLRIIPAYRKTLEDRCFETR